MHQLNVIIIGPTSFISTLIELKSFLKFNIYEEFSSYVKKAKNGDIVIFYKDFLTSKEELDLINKKKLIKILATNKNDEIKNYDGILKIPTTLNEINALIEKVASQKTFIKNSSIKIKDYFLDKNERILKKGNNFLVLTEKEIQLLELFLVNKKPVTKNIILSLVWNYSNDADTHTVETHIYRLRKKISDKFLDSKFILNNKEGYFI
jgi:hypothetical protein